MPTKSTFFALLSVKLLVSKCSFLWFPICSAPPKKWRPKTSLGKPSCASLYNLTCNGSDQLFYQNLKIHGPLFSWVEPLPTKFPPVRAPSCNARAFTPTNLVGKAPGSLLLFDSLLKMSNFTNLRGHSLYELICNGSDQLFYQN